MRVLVRCLLYPKGRYFLPFERNCAKARQARPKPIPMPIPVPMWYPDFSIPSPIRRNPDSAKRDELPARVDELSVRRDELLIIPRLISLAALERKP